MLCSRVSKSKADGSARLPNFSKRRPLPCVLQEIKDILLKMKVEIRATEELLRVSRFCAASGPTKRVIGESWKVDDVSLDLSHHQRLGTTTGNEGWTGSGQAQTA